MKTARKTKSKAKPSRSKKRLKLKPSRNVTSAKRAALAEREAYWSEEIAALRGKTFRTAGQALEALVGVVMTRHRGSAAELEATRQFLILTLQDDPILIEVLSGLLTRSKLKR